MILLDTDHVSVLKYPENPTCVRLRVRMAASPDKDFKVTVVTVEEQLRGWLAEIARARTVTGQVIHYQDLADLFGTLSQLPLVSFDDRAAGRFERLRTQKVRIGTMDLKIAAIALANDALLLSANLRDYAKVPALRVENWLRA
jgi:tRNA(fMet)-specific endonuclease VapC